MAETFTWTGDWSPLPGTLRTEHVCAIYAISNERSLWRLIERGDARIPAPCMVKPYRWRKADVQHHYETQTVTDQRRALAVAAKLAKAG